MSIYDFLHPLIDVTLIRAYQNADAPPKPYATYFIVTNSQFGKQEVAEPNEAGFRQVGLHRYITVQVDFYGKDAMDKAQKLANYLNAPTVIDQGTVYDININNVEQVRNMTDDVALLAGGLAKGGTQYEVRAMLEFRFLTTSMFEEESQYITEVEFEGDITPNTEIAPCPKPPVTVIVTGPLK